jgi:hypothetical protein
VECIEHSEAILESTTLAADLDDLAKEILNPKRHADNFEPTEDVKLIPLDPTSSDERALKVSTTLDPKYKAVQSLRYAGHICVESLRYANIFAWSPLDMSSIPREVTEHALEIQIGFKPVKQHMHRFDEEKRKVIGEKIHKLLEAGFIKEVHHPKWLANPVLVKKKSGKWRMCVDYTSLNKACPKVPFPLPHIDQIIDSTAGCETLSFLDAYSDYHQIKMKESDQLATSFITPFVMYCYVTMPFGLQNTGATYQ